jgi:predicted SprT family Zn-dependent metalloprotease
MQDSEIEKYVTEESLRLGIDEPLILLRKARGYYGMAYCWNWKIHLNKTWVHKASDVLVKEVISHELMHLRYYWIMGKSDHSKAFKEMCDEFGIRGKSCFPKKEQRKMISACKKVNNI